MKNLGKSLIAALGLSTALALSGCENNKYPNQVQERPTEVRNYFDRITASYSAPITIREADFDNDGDLDLVVGSYDSQGIGKLYFFENDGKGNFTKRLYTNK